jgi:phosphatase and actin regulator 4
LFVVWVPLGTSPAEEKKEREEKKMTLFRKLSFRPTVEELKARKVRKIKENE